MRGRIKGQTECQTAADIVGVGHGRRALIFILMLELITECVGEIKLYFLSRSRYVFFLTLYLY